MSPDFGGRPRFGSEPTFDQSHAQPFGTSDGQPFTRGGFTLHESVGVYVISVAAELAGMHPQTLRTYDRLGLVSPTRSSGRGRRYSMADVRRLQHVQRLSQDEGLNLEGIRRVLELSDQVDALQRRVQELTDALVRSRTEAEQRIDAAHASHRRDLVPVDRTAAAVVVYQRPPRR